MKLEQRIDPYGLQETKLTQQLMHDYLDTRRKINLRLAPYTADTKVHIKDADLPLKIIHVGDTHLAHVATNPDGLQNAVNQTGEGLLILQGNIIDSVSNKFLTSTVNIGLNLDQQVAQAAAIVEPLDKNGQVILVGANTCHEGWAVKTSSHDPSPDFVSKTTPKLYTGGQVILCLDGKPAGSAELYHNPGKTGRTMQSPEGALRAHSRELPFGHPDKADVLVGAHMHQLTAGQDVVRSPIDRRDHVTSLGEVGSVKGSKENPDTFLVGLGVPPRNQPGDAGEGFATIWKKRGGKLKPYPVAGYKRAHILHEAEQIWENAQRIGVAEEITGEMLAEGRFEEPAISLNSKKSLIRHNDTAAKTEGKSPLYKTLSYDIDSELPIRIQFIGNLRVGSSSLERGKINEVLDDINSDPWAYYFATRRLVNQGTALSSDRKETLIKMTNLLSRAPDSLLGIMITDDLRSKAWGRPLKEDLPIIPGDWLYQESDLKGTPLILPETVANIRLKSNEKKTDYTLYLRDKLSHFASLLNPANGLTRIQEVWGIDADALIGGHTEQCGWRTWMRPWGQLEVIVPGGFAEYVEKGIGNRVDYPTGAQGLIIHPDEKLLYSFASHADGRDMHQALWLRAGYNKLGKLDQLKTKLIKKSKKVNERN